MSRLGAFFAQTTVTILLTGTLGGLPSFGEVPNRRFPPAIGHGNAVRNAANATARDYGIVPIPLPPDAIGGYAVSINNRRTVVGQVILPNGDETTFVYSNGNLELISHPTDPITSVASLADSDNLLFGNWGTPDRQTAGTYDRKTRTFQAFPDVPGKPLNIGWQMNNAGVALGSACEGSFFATVNCVYWLRRNGSYEFLDLPPLDQLLMRSINDRGQISGQYLLAPPFDYRVFVYENGIRTDLPIAQDAAAFGINNLGQVLLNVEFSTTDFFRPGLYDRGMVTRLPDAPGTFSTVWFGLNERGDLVGGAVPDVVSPPLPFVAFRN